MPYKNGGKDEWRRRNPEKWSAERKRMRQRRKERIRKFLQEFKASHPCACGESDPACLDFHHHSVAGKNREVSSMKMWSVGALTNEIMRCITICSNCHRKGHAGRPIKAHRRFFKISRVGVVNL